MAATIADLIIVWSYSDNTADAFESCDWYAPDSFWRLHFSVRDFIERQLRTFYMMFSEWFNFAEYPYVEEQLDPPEVIVFRRGAGAPADADVCEIGNYDCFEGLRAVLRHRLDQESLEQTKQAAELFNWMIDFGLFLSEEKATAVVKVESLETFAPFLLERIIDHLSDDLKRQAEHKVPVGSFDTRFVPLAPVLEMLKEAVGNPNWMQNQLAVDLVFWIVGLYRAEIEAEG
jgi:hypothetical protein